MSAAKFDNRATSPIDQEGRGGKIQFPIFPIKGGRLNRGRGIKIASFLIKREVLVTSSIPFGAGPRAEELRQIGKSAFLCFVFNSQISLICLIISRTTLRESESVVVSPSGSLLRLKSTILEFCLLDSSFALAER